MARGFSRHPYSGYAGYGHPSTVTGSPAPEASPDDYPRKQKEHTAAEHLEILQKYHDEKKAAHGAMWRPPEQYHKDIALNQAMAKIERTFPNRK